MAQKTTSGLADNGYFLTFDGFHDGAGELRSEFDHRFKDPKQPEADRFVWDYWHVPRQYTLLRTPAYHFFSAPAYKALHERLLQFGREHLGCADLTPPWLSCYVEGCRQELHADVPHGPWAFVFSLSPAKDRKYTGGETQIFKPGTLNYWTVFDTFKGVELPDLVTTIPADFNRLVVFDPRIPHGVTPVHGTHDPREGRLVIHGWFTDPQPYINGPLNRKSATDRLNDALGEMEPLFEEFADLHGTLSLRLDVAPAGEVSDVRVLTNTLLSLTNENGRIPMLLKRIDGIFRATKFGKAKSASSITLPLLFRF